MLSNNKKKKNSIEIKLVIKKKVVGRNSFIDEDLLVSYSSVFTF